MIRFTLRSTSCGSVVRFVSNGNIYEYGEDGEGNPIYRADIQLRIEAGRFDAAQEELMEGESGSGPERRQLPAHHAR